MPEAAATGTKWSSDTFLNTLRDRSDPLADACQADLPPEESLAFFFANLRTDATLPAESELPPAFAKFLRDARPSLDLVDDLSEEELANLKRGQQVFTRNALPVSLVLLSKSLQEGYQAPRLGKVLMMSGQLESSTYRRVLGVLQMMISVATPGSFDPKLKSSFLPSSDAGLTAIRVRLMHAGLRGMAKRTYPDFTRQFGGSPISLEDMLATLMAFSWLVMDGFDILKISLGKEDADAWHFVWKVFARQMGIHPPGQPKSWDCIPANLAEAREFYQAYSRRHYAKAADNAEGIELANANLRMLSKRMPPLAARIYMVKLIGPKACEALGIKSVPLLFIWKALLLNFPRVWISIWRILDRRKGGVQRHDQLTASLLQRLVILTYNAGVPTYRVPREVSDITEVVKGTQPGLNFGLNQFLTQVFPAELGDIVARRDALKQDAEKLKPATGAGQAKPTKPSADRGLVGLALSGGGIRSATFALGAVQALARNKCLKMVDYLSTVSGGGYTGGMLSSVLNDRDSSLEGKSFPLDYEVGQIEPPALRHLRNGGNYLAGGGLLSEARLPMLLIRGILLNFVLVLPYVMGLVIITLILFPYEHEYKATAFLVWGTLLLFLGAIISYPSVSWFRILLGKMRTWQQRDRQENLQAILLILFVAMVIASILSGMVFEAISADPANLRKAVGSEVMNPVDALDAPKWLLIALIAYAVVKVGKLAKAITARANRVLLFVLGLTGPALILGAYLLMIVYVGRSPYLSTDRAAALDAAAAATPPIITDSALLADLVQLYLAAPYSKIRVTADDTTRSWYLADTAIFRWADTTRGKSDTISIQTHADTVVYPVERIVAYGPYLKIEGLEFYNDDAGVGFFVIAVVLLILNMLFIDINFTSPHGFWRDKLSSVFLFRSRWFGKPTPNDQLKMSELGNANPAVPYHIVNTCLNLTGSRVEDLPGRAADFFMFSRRFAGSYATGYCTAELMEETDPHIDLGTAMAISSAATAPNSGTVTVRPLVFMMTLLNVRLDYWAPNPWFVQASSLVRNIMTKVGRPGPLYLLREALGQLHARGSFVNLSDGGHIENLGVYELLRRRCKVIVAVDAEHDPEMSCASLAKLIRYARIDLGIELDIDNNPLKLDSVTGQTHRHWTLGTIKYGGGETGQFLYIKSSVTGDEAPYVADYRSRNPAFPQESTADQFFDEAQFESYRALGYHSVNGAMKAMATLDAGDATDVTKAEMRVVRDALGLADRRETGTFTAVDSSNALPEA